MDPELTFNRPKPGWWQFARPAMYAALICACGFGLALLKARQKAVLNEGPLPAKYKLGISDPALRSALEAKNLGAFKTRLREAPKASFSSHVLEDLALDKTVPFLEAMLDAGWDADGGLHDGAPLVRAVSSKQVASVRVLLAHSADPNRYPRGEAPPLLTSVQDSDHQAPEIAEMLVRHGAKFDRLMIYSASSSGSPRALQFMYDHGVRLGVKEPGSISRPDDGVLLATAAVSRHPTETIDWLLDHGIDRDIEEKWAIGEGPHSKGVTVHGPAICLMAWRGNTEAVEALLARGASPTSRTSDGRTALELARGECKTILEQTAAVH